MSKYGRLVGGKITDVFQLPPHIDAEDAEAVAAFMDVQFVGLGGRAAFVPVPDDTVNGAEPDGDGGYDNPETPAPAVPGPLNASNAWFGKLPKRVDAFWGLVSFKISPARMARMVSDPAFIGVERVINTNNTIDPDDRDGDFLYFAVYLTDGAVAQLVGTQQMWTKPLLRLAAYKAQGAGFSPLHTDGDPVMDAETEFVPIMQLWT